jgi:hypothetical protein
MLGADVRSGYFILPFSVFTPVGSETILRKRKKKKNYDNQDKCQNDIKSLIKALKHEDIS